MNRKRQIRVCMVGPSLDILGGQAVVAQRLLTRLTEISDLDLSFLPVNPRLPTPLNLFQRLKYARTVVNLIAYCLSLFWRIPRTNIVHAFSASYWSFLLAPLPAMLVGRLFGKRVILNYRSGEADDHLTNWRTAVPLMRLAHLIVVPSDYLVEIFARHGIKAIAVPNFVEINQLPFRRREILRPVFLSNRNFQAHYNVSCVLRAFARIQQKIPGAQLIVVGDGPLCDSLHKEARDLGILNHTFVGAVPPERMAAIYDQADVYLNAPDIDNMPNSILEASACGLPIVTSDAGGIPFIVRNDDTALLVSCGDDAALAAAALRLFDEAGLALRLTTKAREEILNLYIWDAVKVGWMGVYGLDVEAFQE